MKRSCGDGRRKRIRKEREREDEEEEKKEEGEKRNVNRKAGMVKKSNRAAQQCAEQKLTTQERST